MATPSIVISIVSAEARVLLPRSAIAIAVPLAASLAVSLAVTLYMSVTVPRPLTPAAVSVRPITTARRITAIHMLPVPRIVAAGIL